MESTSILYQTLEQNDENVVNDNDKTPYQDDLYKHICPVYPVKSSIDIREKTTVENINADRDAVSKIQYLNGLSLPLEKHKVLDKYLETSGDYIPLRNFLVTGVQWVSMVTENLLGHPFIVLRRQCQVYNASNQYHLHPFGLLPSILHLHRRQGITTLWKGVGSCMLVRGMSVAMDDIISKITGWPKEVNSRTAPKRFGKHILLKCISMGVIVPFYAASLVETVQSDIASEKPGLFDVFREGSLRLINWSSHKKGRMLPACSLIGPSVSLGITKYLFNLVIRGVSLRIMRSRVTILQTKHKDKFSNDILEHKNAEIYANLIAMLTTEVIFFPFETILHRLQLQGTRTIIDNLDNGYAVVPILTNYQGVLDCYRTTKLCEGFSGLYKGFGAMVLQYVTHLAVLKSAMWIVSKIIVTLSNRPPSRIVQYYNTDADIGDPSPSISIAELEVNSI